MSNEIITGNETKISILKDPFEKSKIQSIRISYRKSMFEKTFSASGSIEFKNGLTKGEQDFKGDSIESILSQMKSFLESI